MIINSMNHGVATGRLSKDPVVFENKGGSKNVIVTLAVENNYKTKDGQDAPATFIDFKGFAQADKSTVFDYMHKGDLVTINYEVRSESYEKNGETVYTQALIIRNVDLLESKATTTARLAARAAA